MTNTYPEDGTQAPGMRPEPETSTNSKAMKERVGEARERVRGEAAQFADTARQKAAGAVETQQHKITGAMGDFSDAIRVAGDELTQRNQGMAAQLVRQAADSLEDVTRNLDGKRPGELLDTVRDFGRRHPVAFIGGAVLAGLAIGRFIRASDEPEHGEAYDYDTAGGWEPEARTADGLDTNTDAFRATPAVEDELTREEPGSTPRGS